METKAEQMETIHTSLVNGQGRQMTEQINEYGLYDFWSDYKGYLDFIYKNLDSRYTYFTDATITYHRITNR